MKEKVKEAAPKKIYSLSTDSESIIDELVEAQTPSTKKTSMSQRIAKEVE